MGAGSAVADRDGALVVVLPGRSRHCMVGGSGACARCTIYAAAGGMHAVD